MTTTTFALKYVDNVGFAADQGGRGFLMPTAMVPRGDGRIFVASRSNNTARTIVGIQAVTRRHDFFGQIGGYGSDPGQMIWPSALALDSEDNLYLADDFLDRITVYDGEGEVVSTWGAKGSGDGQIDGPSGLLFDSEDSLLVVDHKNHRIQRFTKDGRYLSQWGSFGSGPGQFNLPWGIAQDGDGNVYVADWGNQRVQVLDPEGVFLQKLRGEATLNPWALEYLDAQADENEARATFVPVYDVDTADPNETSARIEPYFWDPVSVVLDDEDRLYVLEVCRHRFQIYERA